MTFERIFSESRLLPTSHAYAGMTDRRTAELAYLHILSLCLLLACEKTHRDGRHYAERTIRHETFKNWYATATDLHLLLHGLIDDQTEFRDDKRHFRPLGLLDETLIRAWVRETAHGHDSESRTRRLLSRLDMMFHVSDVSLHALRRFVRDWATITPAEQHHTRHEIVRLMHLRAPRSDMLVLLDKLPRHAVHEDATAGATAATAVATVAAPLGAVQRRKPSENPK